MSGAMLGVDHIGVGVSDMERSKAFWAEVGFSDVAFDYRGPLAGPGGVADAHVVWLRPAHPTVLGSGAVKLVALADPPPMPEGMAWGERGVCEVCVHVKAQDKLYQRLVAAGHPALMEPNSSPLDPFGTMCSLSYVADPDGTKIELIEWLDYEQPFPWEDGPQGVNHVAFGVESIERTRAFYTSLGFTGMVFDSDGVFDPMGPWFDSGEAPRMKMTLLTNPFGAGMEPVESFPPSPDMRGEWGHLGPFDFGVGVRNLDVAARAVELVAEPFTVDLGDGASWRYAYFADPDGTYVCLSETRF
jgi:catechol 2,3-dioxygenase-like lactoylglutathione lyase family enzyme